MGDNGVMDPQPVSPRQRLQELLAIPERQRTEAEWDEINELEIRLASSNRQQNPHDPRRNPQQTGHPRPGGPGGKKPFRQFHKRRPNRGPQGSQ